MVLLFYLAFVVVQEVRRCIYIKVYQSISGKFIPIRASSKRSEWCLNERNLICLCVPLLIFKKFLVQKKLMERQSYISITLLTQLFGCFAITWLMLKALLYVFACYFCGRFIIWCKQKIYTNFIIALTLFGILRKYQSHLKAIYDSPILDEFFHGC